MPALDTLRSSQQSSRDLGVRWTCDSDAAACGPRTWPMVASCDSSGDHRLGRAPHRYWRRLGPLFRRRGSVAGSHQCRCRCCRISSRPPDVPQPPEESPTGCPVARSVKSTRPRPLQKGLERRFPPEATPKGDSIRPQCGVGVRRSTSSSCLIPVSPEVLVLHLALDRPGSLARSPSGAPRASHS